MACFHDRCGERVTLLNENRTAIRDYSEFNHGLVISAEPLVNDVLFEVKIDQKVAIQVMYSCHFQNFDVCEMCIKYL